MCIHPAMLLEERQLTYRRLSEILYLLDDIKRTTDPDRHKELTEQASQLCIELRYHYSQLVPDPNLDGGIAACSSHERSPRTNGDRVNVLEMFPQSLSDFQGI